MPHKDPIARAQCKRMSDWMRKCRAIAVLGDQCRVCGQDDIRLMDIDHTNGGGSQDRLVDGLSGNKLYTWIKYNPQEARAKYQALCVVCHRFKTLEERRIVI